MSGDPDELVVFLDLCDDPDFDMDEFLVLQEWVQEELW